MTRKRQIATIVDLPEEVISDILVKLPAKTLLCCQCVCKSWLNLTKNPQFLKLHVSRANQENPKMLIGLLDYFIKWYSLVLDGAYDNLRVENLHVPVAIRRPYEWMSQTVKDSCNGLICLLDSVGVAYMCNLTTREIQKIPLQTPFISWNDETKLFNSKDVLGFFYNPDTEEYKLILLFYSKKLSKMIEIRIYTFGKKTWRTIPAGDLPLNLRNCLRPGISGSGQVRGALHWMGKRCIRDEILDKGTIISFNLAKEEFIETLGPRIGFGYSGVYDIDNRDSLSIFEGRLSLYSHIRKSNVVDIWVMNYGIEESWTKRYSVQVPIWFKVLRPVTSGVDGKIILGNGMNMKEFVSYDLVKCKATVRKVPGAPSGCKRICTYVETITSIASLVNVH